MILSAKTIAGLLRQKSGKDPLIITPTAPDFQNSLNTNGETSVELRLGTWFLSLKQSSMHCIRIATDEKKQITPTTSRYIPLGQEYILHPRSFVLASTLEWIRLPRKISGYVIGKSSLGRHGLVIATATGVHPKFTGCLTLELSNLGEIPIALRPGMQICQLFLHRVETRSNEGERSQFSGARKPMVKHIKFDDFAMRISRIKNRDGAPI